MFFRVFISGFVLVLLCDVAVGRLTRATQRRENDLESGLIPIEVHIKQMGYPVETHQILTEDGYILTYHRIPYGKIHRRVSSRPPVLVQHGLLACSSVWVAVNSSLGFTLADAGYDVWLGNARGNYYSRRHVWYDPDKNKRQFWNFGWHEMGHYDIPAAVDYILNATSHSQLSFVGHSMGTTIYYAFGATRPEYMPKINVAVLMAPIANLIGTRSPVLKFFKMFETPLVWLSKLFEIFEFLRYRPFWYWFVHDVCGKRHTQFICLDLIGIICGFDNEQISRTALPSDINNLPAGTSTKAIVHYTQNMEKEFRQFDYGFFKNLVKYHSPHPPLYDLKRATAPLYLFIAANDWLISVDGSVSTALQLPNIQGLTLVDDVYFSHGDFMWALDAKALVYDNIVDILKKY